MASPYDGLFIVSLLKAGSTQLKETLAALMLPFALQRHLRRHSGRPSVRSRYILLTFIFMSWPVRVSSAMESLPWRISLPNELRAWRPAPRPR